MDDRAHRKALVIVILSLLVVSTFTVCFLYMVAMVIGAIGLLINSRRETAALAESIERHPAGGCPTEWHRPTNHHPFRVPVCGHLVFAASLEDVDLEFAAMTHIDVCLLAQALLPNQEGNAA